ncbi:AraC family transcriptional regulator [Pseudovibrio sp. SPO723]|uniref:AraC family transcriptional regulator n=1 Tax=Nesiotobacter zosterae TaxID=392721 RepID=UPI0029C40A45|nr:AraC family transcriptional regulator [Pseudovibrio sp. SPO723]MDX5594956.1 AraC family transcriptional regulator [Pseudovibrio sp. SPO723]
MLLSSMDWLNDGLKKLASKVGPNQTFHENIAVYRFDNPTVVSLAEHQPALLVFATDSIVGHVAGHQNNYAALTCLLLSPAEAIDLEVSAASREKPACFLKAEIDRGAASDLFLELTDEFSPMPSEQSFGPSFELESAARHCVWRLVQCLSNERDASFLTKGYYRELLYHLALSQQGAAFRRLFHVSEKRQGINRVLQLLKSEYSNSALTVEEMARIACMSTSSFHEGFKAATSKSPLQYIKNIRLQRARSMMLSEGLSASQAAFRVGYASASQFSREYKRLFGYSPSQDLSRFRNL